MIPMRTVRCAAAAAVVLAAACSKNSTGPSDPFVGTWKITWAGVPAHTALTPSPWSLTISKTDTVYSVSYANETWTDSIAGPIDTWGNGTGAIFVIRNDSLLMGAKDANTGCLLVVEGPFSGKTASGKSGNFGTLCQSAVWTWTATKQ